MNAAGLAPAVELVVVAAELEDVVAGAAALVALVDFDDDVDVLLPQPATAIPRTAMTAISARFVKRCLPDSRCALL